MNVDIEKRDVMSEGVQDKEPDNGASVDGEKVAKDSARPISRYRKLLGVLMRTMPNQIDIGGITKDGDMVFSVQLEDLGLSAQCLHEFQGEFFSRYVPSVIGELLVRENLGTFASFLSEYDPVQYAAAVSKSDHRRFGMKYIASQSKITFVFHISLLQEILTEDFK